MVFTPAASTAGRRSRYSPAMAAHPPPDAATVLAGLYDAPRLLALRRALRDVAARQEPRAVVTAGPAFGPGSIRPGATVALLPGSFNPPTAAHLALARAGLEQGADAVLFSLATRTVDKEVVTGAALEDRLLLLELIAARDPRLGVLLVNRGLYVDQAATVRAAFPALGEVVFLVGHDKIVQIFDPRYYDDRDAALDRLFGLARFLVAPRAEAGPGELDALVARPENRRFAPAVRPLDLPPALRDVASSAVRARAAGARHVGIDRALAATPRPGGEADDRPSELDDQLPPECRLFVAETGAYAPEASAGTYRRRLALLDELEAPAAAGLTDDELRTRFRAARQAPPPDAVDGAGRRAADADAHDDGTRRPRVPPTPSVETPRVGRD